MRGQAQSLKGGMKGARGGFLPILGSIGMIYGLDILSDLPQFLCMLLHNDEETCFPPHRTSRQQSLKGGMKGARFMIPWTVNMWDDMIEWLKDRSGQVG